MQFTIIKAPPPQKKKWKNKSEWEFGLEQQTVELYTTLMRKEKDKDNYRMTKGTNRHKKVVIKYILVYAEKAHD